MTYDFDRVIERHQTGSSKWDTLATRFGREDVLPMWVADMDFASPQCVLDALHDRLAHGVFGYAVRMDAYHESIVQWMEKRHGWKIDGKAIAPAPGVVPALTVIVQAFTEPGDGILIQPPVYHPFKRVIESWGRTAIENPLVYRDGSYHIDFTDLEEKAKRAKVMFLCSPHNPVGRVWTREELELVGDICMRHQVLVIADEIHADLVFEPHHHVPFASLSPQFAANSITCAAPSKTFNLAGFHTAYIIAENAALRTKYEQMLSKASMNELNVFGVEAMIAAYRGGAEWLDALIAYLAGNLNFLRDFLEREIPEVKVVMPEGTYLVWLDFRSLGMDRQALDQFLVEQARIALNEGHLFGANGEGFARMNIGCPRSLLEEGLSRLATAVREHLNAR